MSADNGGPAFPVAQQFDERRGEYVQYGDSGMTLRDYFAAKALVALIAEPAWSEGSDGLVHLVVPHCDGGIEDRYARAAYKMADAMLRARQS